MKKVSEINILVVCLAIGLFFMAFPGYAVANDGEVPDEEFAQTDLGDMDVDPEFDAEACKINDIFLTTPGGSTLYAMPRGKAFYIWARWSCPKNGLTLRTKILRVRSLTTKYYYTGKKISRATNVIGSADVHTIPTFADKGQWVKVKASVTDRGSRIEWFRVQ